MQWLETLFGWIFKLFPRFWFVQPNESGVIMTLGKYVRETGTNWYIVWPVIQNTWKVDVTPQVVDLKNQSIRTKDNKSIVVSGAISYEINDARKFILEVNDPDKSLQTLALGIVAEYTHKRSLDECQDFEAVKDEILHGIRDEVKGWGIKIRKIYITDLAETQNIRLLVDKNDIPFIN